MIRKDTKSPNYLLLFGTGLTTNEALQGLEKEVNGALKLGYTLQGGASITTYTSPSSTRYCIVQAVSRKD